MRTISRFEYFAERTTMHGFRELPQFEHRWQKVIWFLIVGMSVVMLIAFVYLQTSRYLQGSTATKVSRLGSSPERIREFPPIWLGNPKWSWIDAKKVRALNLSSEEIRLALSYVANKPFKIDSIRDLPGVKKTLREKMDKYGFEEILHMLNHIRLDVYDATEQHNFIYWKYITGDKVYYQVNTSSIVHKNDLMDVWIYYKVLNYSLFWVNLKQMHWNVFEKNMSDSEMEEIRLNLLNIDTYMDVKLEPGYAYKINTDSDIYKPMEECTSDYSVHEPYYVPSCRSNCELLANESVRASSCVPYDMKADAAIDQTKLFKSGNMTICHPGWKNSTSGLIGDTEEPEYRLLTQKEETERDRMKLECQKKCLPRCEQWATYWNVFTYKSASVYTDTTLVQFVFPDSKRLVLVEEVQQYQWHDLVSDFGGLLGLWLGASMISVFQIVHLCLAPPSRRKETGGGTDGDEAAGATKKRSRKRKVFSVSTASLEEDSQRHTTFE